jgi:hypothetical protein
MFANLFEVQLWLMGILFVTHQSRVAENLLGQ